MLFVLLFHSLPFSSFSAEIRTAAAVASAVVVGLVYGGKDGHGAEARLATAAQNRTPRCVGCFVAEGSHVNVEDVGVDLFHMDPTSGGDGR